jgi:hypothetical protein
VFDREVSAKVLVVDWTNYADFRLPCLSAPFIKQVANDLTNLLQFLSKNCRLNMKRVHLIGNGLGAHVAGNVGHKLAKKNLKIARITGDYNSFKSNTSGSLRFTVNPSLVPNMSCEQLWIRADRASTLVRLSN